MRPKSVVAISESRVSTVELDIVLGGVICLGFELEGPGSRKTPRSKCALTDIALEKF